MEQLRKVSFSEVPRETSANPMTSGAGWPAELSQMGSMELAFVLQNGAVIGYILA